MALRTFIGCFITLISTFTNLTLVVAIDGERGWLCLTLCLCDGKCMQDVSMQPFSRSDLISGSHRLCHGTALGQLN